MVSAIFRVGGFIQWLIAAIIVWRGLSEPLMVGGPYWQLATALIVSAIYCDWVGRDYGKNRT